MVSFNHDIDRLGKGDQGGPWLLNKSSHTYIFGHYKDSRYKGPTLPWANPAGFPQPSIGAVRTDASYAADGAKAVAATEPSKAVFNGPVFIGETASDGLPAMAGVASWRDRTFRAKQAGSEYLNYEFGWLPLVSDIQSFAKAVVDSHQILSKYEAESDQKVRRHLLLTDDLTQNTLSGVYSRRTPGLRSIGSTTTHYTSSLREKMWFSGAFRYHIPMDDSTASRLKRHRLEAHKLYGAGLTPDVVWNVAPWSWAIDWQTDIGAVVHNWSALGHNGLVMQYGYIMHEQESSWSAVAMNPYSLDSRTVVRKRRVAANPYGFGVKFGSLNTTQLAVLAAIGLSGADQKIIR